MKLDPVAAECGGLAYVNDAIPGITRERREDGWRYLRPDGTEIVDPAERVWIDAIGIPPRGRRYGSVPHRTATFWPPAGTVEGASSTAITRAGRR